MEPARSLQGGAADGCSVRQRPAESVRCEKGRMKARALRIALALASVAFTLLVFELLLRVLPFESQTSDRRGLHVARPDRLWLYGMRPGVEGTLPISGDVKYRVNADGFRDSLYLRPKPENTFRVIVLGDSVAFGYGVAASATFAKRMEREIAASVPGRRVEILNLGVSGYNPYTQAQLLRDLGLAYEPDLVLVQFCINDLNDPTLHFDVQTRLHLGSIPDAAYPDPTTRRTDSAEPGAAYRGCRQSRICSLADDLWLSVTAETPDSAANRAAGAPVEGDAGPEWAWLEALYLEMAEFSRAAGAEFAVLAFPYPAQVLSAGEHPVQRRLVALGERQGWTTVDPLERFRAAHRAGTSLFLDWWHPTVAGHRLAAQEAVEALARAGLLPE